VPATTENVLGVLSLIIYALLLVISLKYVVVGDARRQSGRRRHPCVDRRSFPSRKGVAGTTPRLAMGRPVLVALGIFGTALLYGDGMITTRDLGVERRRRSGSCDAALQSRTSCR
jgi:KUP system potassium uptake protein